MKLNAEIIEAIGKKLQTGCPAKYAAMSEGITEACFYLWKADGKLIHERVTDKEGELKEKEYKKLMDTEKLKFEFFESISRSIAQGHVVLTAAIYSQIKDDWKAALEILSRRFPKDWAKRDQLHIDQVVEEKPNKLKEIEDEVFEGIPAKNRKEVIEKMSGVIEEARNGKNPGKTKRKSKASA